MLAGITLLQGILCVLLILTCLLLIGVVLLQKGRGGGLSAAFGGAGGQSAFGSKTGDVLTWFTVALAGAFLLLGVVGNYAFERSVDKQPTVGPSPAGGAPSPAAPPAQAPSPVPVTAEQEPGTAAAQPTEAGEPAAQPEEAVPAADEADTGAGDAERPPDAEQP